MDRFQNVNLDLICTRYNGNELLLVRDLMAAGLISPVAPKCHGDMVLTSSKPWQWRCMGKSKCNKCISVTPGSFLDGKRKLLSVFKAAYLFSWGFSPKQILHETDCGERSLRDLLSQWRQAIMDCSEEDSKLGGQVYMLRGVRGRCTLPGIPILYLCTG